MKIDMSQHAITMRLKQSSELRTLCIALGGKRLRKLLKDKANRWENATQHSHHKKKGQATLSQ